MDSLTAEVAVTGRAGGQRLRGRLLVGLERNRRVRVEALAPFGQPMFVLAADGERSTLLLPRDRRVVTGASVEDLLEALAGLRLDAAALHDALTGCVAAGTAREPVRLPGGWSAVSLEAGGRAFVRELNGSPRVTAGEISPRGSSSIVVGYDAFGADGLPRVVRLVREGRSGSDRVALDLRLSQVEIDAPIADRAFSIDVPADALPMTLDELRRAGPLAGRE